MPYTTFDEKQDRFSPLKFEAGWEVVRAGLTWLSFAAVIILVYFTLFNFINGFSMLFSIESGHSTEIFLATLITLFLLRPLKAGIQSLIDYVFFQDTANLKDEIDKATHTLTEIHSRQQLQTFLINELPNRLQVDGIFLHQHSQSPLRHALTLPLHMGNRSMGYLTIGPKKSGRSYSQEEQAMFKTLQDQVSLVLSAIQLAETREEAEKIDELKSNFVSNISHQLHTPLNTVINSTGLVADGALGDINAEQANYLNRAVQGSEYLMHLLEEILDITKIESGELTLQLGQVDLKEVVDNTIALVRGTLQNRSVELRVEIADNLPLLTADQTRLGQIMFNLLSNAVKFTREGYILVKARENRGTIFVSVEDTGIGIAKENLSLIFEDYQQVSTMEYKDLRFARRRHLGTGLGMPITKALVELHGGHIWVETEPGKGTIFTFTLPSLRSDANNGNKS